MSLRSFLVLFVCIGASLAAGFVGSLFTVPSIDSWYTTLVQPSWTPPNWVFGPVWNALYVLMGVAAFLVTRSPKPSRILALWFFFAHLILNALWSIVFFGLKELLLSVVVIVLLWLVIIALIRVFSIYSKTAAWLLMPYLLWVTYAATVNIGVFVLN